MDHFAQDAGLDLRIHDLDLVQDWEEALKEAADATRKLLLPYLLGERNDFEDIEHSVKKRAEKAVEELDALRFPPNVIKKS